MVVSPPCSKFVVLVKGSPPSGGKSGKPILPTTARMSRPEKEKGRQRPVGTFAQGQPLPYGEEGFASGSPYPLEVRCHHGGEPYCQQTPEVSTFAWP